MKEYLNLLNRVDEGIIVIASDKNDQKSNIEERIRFCSQKALKIIKPEHLQRES